MTTCTFYITRLYILDQVILQYLDLSVCLSVSQVLPLQVCVSGSDYMMSCSSCGSSLSGLAKV